MYHLTSKAKNARSKRAMAAKEPQETEGVKQALFVKGTSTSTLVGDAMRTLYALKKPHATNFAKKNDVHPFEDGTSLEFFSVKTDCALIVLANHNKKRPNNLTLMRTYNHKILDMIELGVVNCSRVEELQKGMDYFGKPLFHFIGDAWSISEPHRHLQSMLIDMYHGQIITQLPLHSLEHAYVIQLTALSSKIIWHTFAVKLKKGKVNEPIVELEDRAPSFEFELRRSQLPDQAIWKSSQRRRQKLEKRVTKKKNVQLDEMGDQVGRIHLGRQPLTGLVTRKMKGLDVRRDVKLSSPELDLGDDM